MELSLSPVRSSRSHLSPRSMADHLFYGPYSNFYGNLVVMSAHFPRSQAFPEITVVLDLYGHLCRNRGELGQSVQTGQRIGSVAVAGIATGSHLVLSPPR